MKSKILLLIMTLSLAFSASGCGVLWLTGSNTDSSVVDTTENTDTPDEDLQDKKIGESVTIYGVTVTVNSVAESQTSTGRDAYEVSVTYKNNSGKDLTVNPYDWSSVRNTGTETAHVGGDCSFHSEKISNGEEWTGVVTLWKYNGTEKVQFESSSLNLLQDDKSATWVIVSDKKNGEETAPSAIDSTESSADAPTEPPTDAPTEPPTDAPTEPSTIAVVEPKTLHFILNADTNCIHIKSTCSAAEKILPENYQEIDIAEDELENYAGIYWACGKCSKRYSDRLPRLD